MGEVGILIRLGISALALWIATLIIPGISLETDSLGGAIGTLVAVAVIFGVVNAVLRPIIKVVGCGFYLLTLGLVALIVNGLLFMLTGWIAGELSLPFEVDGFWSALFGALLVSIVSWALNLFVPDGDD
nr:phage holin family protein [Catenuloplanes atrovinosus]